MDVDLETASREELVQLVKQLLERIAALEAENEQLRQQLGKKQPPHWAKPNRPKPQQPRRKRAPEHNHGRPCEPPTRTVQHA